MLQQILESISPEQWLIFFTGVAGFIGTVAYGLWKLFDYWFKQRMDLERANQEKENKRVQAELDETHYSWDTIKGLMMQVGLLLEQNATTRKEDIEQRKEIQVSYANHLGRMEGISQGIQANTGATLEMLKGIDESNKLFDISLKTAIAKHDTTHSKLTEISTDLSAINKKIDNLTFLKETDKKTLENIQSSILSLREYVETLSDKIITRPIPPELIAQVLEESKTAVTTAPVVKEVDKELNVNTNEDKDESGGK